MGTLSFGCSPLIYRNLVCEFFRKNIILASIPTNIYRPYMCDPLGLYVSLVNNFIEQIKHY